MGNKKFRTLRKGIFRYLSSFKESNNLVVESLFVKTQGPKVNFRDGLMYWGTRASFLEWGQENE